MADILASVSVVLGAEISGFKAAMAEARKDMKGLVQFAEGMKGLGDGLTRYLTLPLAGIGVASVAASAKLESLKKGIEAISAADLGKQGITGLGGLQLAASQAGDGLKVLETIAKAPGIGFEQAVAGDIRLRAVGISATQSAKSLKEFANAIATTGGGASEFDRVTTQLAQLSAKGKVLSQDLRPIIEAAPAVSQALLKLYGTIDSETISASLTKQGKSSQDFIAILTDELAKLPRVTGGLANAFENLQQTAVQSAAKLGDGISRALNLPALTEGLANGLERLSNGFANLAPGTQKLIVGLGVAAAATGPLLVAIGTLGAALPALTAGFATLGITSAAALGPIGIAAVAIAAGAALIIDHWDDLTAYFSSSGEGGRVFGDLATSVTNSISQISDAFSALNSSGNFGDLVSATGVFKAVLRDITVGITAVSNVVGGLIGTFVELGRGIKDTLNGSETYGFSRALQQAETALVGIVQPLANVLGFQLRLSEATQGVKEKFDALAVATPGLAAVLNNLSGITPFPVVNLGAATRTLGLLEQLKARLKEVQDQRDKETTVPAIKVDNAEIISLQKQIAALEGIDKAGKKTTDAITKLRQELSRLTALDNLLGDAPSQVQVLERRSNTLTTGLKTLVDAGVSTSSRAFRGFAADLANTGQALDKLKGAASGLNIGQAKLTGLLPRTIGDTLPADVARLLGDYAKKPIELPLHLEIKPIVTGLKGSLADGLFDAFKGLDSFKGIDTKGLGEPLIQYGNALRDASNTAAAFGSTLGALFNGFDTGAAKVNAAQAYLQDLRERGFGPLSPAIQSAIADLRQYSIQSENARILSQAFTEGAATLGTALGEAVGKIAFAGAGIGDFVKTIGAGIIEALADFAQKKGNLLVALGIADLATPGFQAIGAAELAGGLGLLAAAGVARAGAASLASATPVASSSVSMPTPTNYGQNSNSTQKIVVEVVSRLRAGDLVAVGRGDAYRNRVGN